MSPMEILQVLNCSGIVRRLTNRGVTARQYNDTWIERKTVPVKDKIRVINMFNSSVKLSAQGWVKDDVIGSGGGHASLSLGDRVIDRSLISYS